MDIYDIPIAKVTDDFLGYIQAMEQMNIDLASEFILVASTLMRIKAKLLLPRKELDAAGNEIDPREELVERLLEYKRYKSVLEDLRRFELERSQKEVRGNSIAELKLIAQKALVDAELESLTLFKLLKTFEGVLKRFDDANKTSMHTVVKYDYTIKGQKEYIETMVQQFGKMDFVQLFQVCKERIHAVFLFLALLDLLQLQVISIVIGEGLNNFWLLPKIETTDEPIADL